MWSCVFETLDLIMLSVLSITSGHRLKYRLKITHNGYFEVPRLIGWAQVRFQLVKHRSTEECKCVANSNLKLWNLKLYF